MFSEAAISFNLYFRYEALDPGHVDWISQTVVSAWKKDRTSSASIFRYELSTEVIALEPVLRVFNIGFVEFVICCGEVYDGLGDADDSHYKQY